ncbi:hypothetical protein HN51_007152 [Arachis hypogaea]|uniref:uncharacterized protein n=1 Tax=Arachis hypogaea TaxID=3818 RepID=UPI000DEC5415|nr:homeobox-leucine zipper protein HAT5 [Arachis hypogaea]QHO41216.1 Homeobox-leucine zipper protein [Arachis hypogaea]
MASGKLYGGSSMSLLLQNESRLPSSSQVLDSLWLHTSDPSSFQGSKNMVVDFENGRGSSIRDRSFFQQGLIEKEENNNNGCDDDYDPSCFQQTGSNGGNSKKRRLTSEQVQFLERSFEMENKLEPERKVQLAKELGLQPRQVAIWFQNRRARFKTKQLEKEYGALKASFDKLKGDYESLLQQNDKLKQEVNALRNKLIPRDKEDENCSSDEKSSPQDVDTINSNHNKEEDEPVMMELMISNSTSNENGSKMPLPHPIILTCKQEDANSAKSDVLDDSADSPHCTNNGNHDHHHHHFSSFMEEEPADSDDFSQDDDDNLSENLLTLPCLPKVEDNDACYHEQNENTCGFGFPVEDQTFCFWPY